MAGFLLTESKRRTLAIFASVVCFLCLVPSLALIIIGGFTRVAVESKIRLIEDYRAASLPTVIMCIGLYSGLHNTVAGAVLWACRRPKMREKRSKCLFPGVVLGIILCVALFLLALIAFGQTMYLETSFHNGLINAMELYKKDATMKAELDQLQIQFKCCGNSGYTDWFKVSWIKDNYISSFNPSSETRRGGYINDDVPFSCCNVKSPRPCINHHVHDNDMHYNYDYKSKTTIYSGGCKKAMLDFYGKKLMNLVGLVHIGVMFFQILIVCLTRIIQTSIAAALELGDPEATTMGYLTAPKAQEEDDDNEDGDDDYEKKPLMKKKRKNKTEDEEVEKEDEEEANDEEDEEVNDAEDEEVNDAEDEEDNDAEDENEEEDEDNNWGGGGIPPPPPLP